MHDIITVQDKLFIVRRKFKESNINLEKGKASTLKELYRCDTVFKAQGYIWVCNEIPEIEYEEIKKSTENPITPKTTEESPKS
jgi:hypothetical protein